MSSRWSFACPDWEDRLREGRSLVPDLPLDQRKAGIAKEVFNRLRIPDVPGQPEMRVAAGDWFRDIVGALWGSLDDTGRRLVPEVFALVPKKNSKTTGGAGIMVTALYLNNRPRAEFVLIGPTHEVAQLAFDQAEGMIAADEHLTARFHVQAHKKTIVDRTNQAKLKIKTFDMKVMTGVKPAGVLIDELHIMSSIGGADRVIGQARGGLMPNPEGFLVIITTQADVPPAGVFQTELQYARGIRDGRITDRVRMLPVLYEFPEAVQTDPEQPWRDPKLWPQITPNLGRSITIDAMQDGFAEAKDKGEAELRRWASQHLNIEIGMALHSDRWAGADHWEAAGDRSLTLESVIARSEVLVVGVDGGGLDDLFGLCVAGRCAETRQWLYWLKAWAHQDVLDRRKEIEQALRDFAKDGDLVICETPTQDIDEVVDIIARCQASGKLPEEAAIGLDPQGIAALVDELVLAGIERERMIGIGQGYRLHSAVVGLARKLSDGTAKHDGSRLGAWCVGNAKAVLRGNAQVIEKSTSGKAKIDPLIAAMNATKLLERSPEAPKPKARPFITFA